VASLTPVKKKKCSKTFDHNTKLSKSCTTSKEFWISYLWNFLWKWERCWTKTSNICSNTGNSKQHFQAKFGPKIF